jgi:hypothetical protein
MKKNFEVDWDDLDEIRKLRQKLKSRYEFLNPLEKSRAEVQSELYNNIQNIWNSDISYMFDNEKYDILPNYYVYCHMLPSKPIILTKQGRPTAIYSFAASIGCTNVPFYIGKGKNNRAFDANRNSYHTKIKEFIRELNHEPITKILIDNLTEKDAIIKESKLIDIFGLIVYNGLLVNIDEGPNKQERRFFYKEDLYKISEKRKSKVFLFEKRNTK